MINYFLKKQEYTKLKTLQFIGNKKQTNIQELMLTFDLSRASIKRNISEINVFFDSTSDFITCNIKQDILFNFSLEIPENTDLTTIYYTYQHYLLNDSLQFQTIEQIFNNPSLSLQQLSSNLYISINRCYKIITQLNESLKYYQLSVNIRNNFIELDGEEHNIRFMYCILLYTGYQNIAWPFAHSSYKFIKDSFMPYREKYVINKPLSTQLKVDFYLAILYKQLSKGNYLPAFEDLRDITLQAFLDVHDITHTLTYFPLNIPTIKNKQLEKNERKEFNLIMRFLDPEIDSLDYKIKIGEKLLELNNPITNFHKNLNTSFISNHFKVGSYDLLPIFMYYTVLYHLFSCTYSYSQNELLNISPLNQNNLVYEKSDFSMSITTFIDEFLKTQSTFPFSISQTAIQMIGLLHYSLYISYYKNSLSVYVQYSRTPIGNEFIKRTLMNIFSTESLTFTSDSKSADIIISDSIENRKNNSNSFFLEDIYNVSLWKELFTFIQELLFELYNI